MKPVTLSSSRRSDRWEEGRPPPSSAMQPSPFPALSVRLRNAWQTGPELAIEHHFRGDMGGDRRCEETTAIKPVWTLSGGRVGEWKSTRRCPGAARISSRPSHRAQEVITSGTRLWACCNGELSSPPFPKQTLPTSPHQSSPTSVQCCIHSRHHFSRRCLTFHHDHTLPANAHDKPDKPTQDDKSNKYPAPRQAKAQVIRNAPS